jgi:chromosome segregation ATPase
MRVDELGERINLTQRELVYLKAEIETLSKSYQAEIEKLKAEIEEIKRLIVPTEESWPMALDDTQEAEIKDKLAKAEAELARLQQVADKQRSENDEIRGKLEKEKPPKRQVDPDITKDIAELKAEVATLKDALGKSVKPRLKLPNLFGG